MLHESHYTCEACGETIEIVVDSESGRDQEYVEDCPVCCRPHLLRVHVDGDDVFTRAELE